MKSVNTQNLSGGDLESYLKYKKYKNKYYNLLNQMRGRISGGAASPEPNCDSASDIEEPQFNDNVRNFKCKIKLIKKMDFDGVKGDTLSVIKGDDNYLCFDEKYRPGGKGTKKTGKIRVGKEGDAIEFNVHIKDGEIENIITVGEYNHDKKKTAKYHLVDFNGHIILKRKIDGDKYKKFETGKEYKLCDGKKSTDTCYLFLDLSDKNKDELAKIIEKIGSDTPVDPKIWNDHFYNKDNNKIFYVGDYNDEKAKALF